MESGIRQDLIQAIQDARSPIAGFLAGMTLMIPGNSPFPQGSKFVLPTLECPIVTSDKNHIVNSIGHYELELDPSLQYLHRNQSKIFDLVNTVLTGAIIMVGDRFASHDYLDKSPLYEFLRHSRNSIAHGNRINITRPMKRIASFKGYVFSKDLNGSVFLGSYAKNGFFHSGDALALFDALERSLHA